MLRRFLTARWHSLAMLNYPIEPAVLRPLVPKGTELDTFAGTHFVSVVGFLFLRTRVLGIPVPFHRDFEEINLRFYVRRLAPEGWRRGVVFVKEVVQRVLIAWVARRLYNENYVACPTSSVVRLPAADSPGLAEYRWQAAGRPNVVAAEFAGQPQPLTTGSEEEFITEHYWGYVPQRDGSVLEYRVEHPPWRVWRATGARLDCDVRGFYGDPFHEALSRPPHSAFVAEGSAVSVYRGEGVAR